MCATARRPPRPAPRPPVDGVRPAHGPCARRASARGGAWSRPGSACCPAAAGPRRGPVRRPARLRPCPTPARRSAHRTVRPIFDRHRRARSISPTDGRATPPSCASPDRDHGMMTAVMDRTLLAPRPAPPAPRTTRPHHAAVPTDRLRRAGRRAHDVRRGHPGHGRGRHRARARHDRRAPRPDRGIERRRGARAAVAAGHLPELVAARRGRRRRRRLRPGAPVRAGRLRRAHRPARAARRPAVAPAGQGALRPDRHRLPQGQARPRRAVPHRGVEAVGGEVAGRRPRAAVRPAAQLAVRRVLRDERPGGRQRPVRRPAAGHLPGHRRTRRRRPHRLRRPARRRDRRRRRPHAEVERRVPRGRRPGRLPAARLREGRGRLRRRRPGDHRQEADRLLGQRHRGLLEGGLAEGQLQPGRAAARPQRVRAGHRVGQGRGHGG